MKKRRIRNLDPSRTVTLRRKFMSDISKRVRKLKSEINKFFIEDDTFGLLDNTPIATNAGKYVFATDPEKVILFKGWLQKQVDMGILEADRYPAWTSEYIGSAYKKGVVRSYMDLNKEAVSPSEEFFAGGKAQFLTSAFTAPETTAKLQLIFTRAYDSLKGFTDQMVLDTSRILATGLSNGWGANKVARELNKRIIQLTRKRAMTIARTEMVHAHAEGQLYGFEKLGVEEVGLMAEWSTAGDDRVCPECEEMEGQIFKVSEAHGLIPLHPNCRCAWIPSLKGIHHEV